MRLNLIRWVLIGLAVAAILGLYTGLVLAQSAPNVSVWENAADSAARIVGDYGWPLAAFLGSPLIVFRLTNWYKMLNKRKWGRKPAWWLMDVGSFVFVFALSHLLWLQHRSDVMEALLVGIIVAACNTMIVKAIFRYAPLPVAEVLAEGASEDSTMVAGILAGRRDREDNS